MKYLKFPILLMILAVLLSACWSANEKKTEVKKQKETNQKEFEKIKERLKEKPQDSDKESDKKEDSKNADANQENKESGKLSPTDTLKEFDAATIAKDVDRIKKVITKSSIDYFEKEAKKRGMTFKQLVEQPNEMPSVETPEMRNEKIDGNKATVEAKNRFLGTFDKYPLVKEDGVWKVSYDVYLKQKLEEINKGIKP